MTMWVCVRVCMVQEMAYDTAHIRRLEERLRQGLQSKLEGIQINGPEDLKHR